MIIKIKFDHYLPILSSSFSIYLERKEGPLQSQQYLTSRLYIRCLHALWFHFCHNNPLKYCCHFIYRQGNDAHTDYVTCPKPPSSRALIWASEVWPQVLISIPCRQPDQLKAFSLPERADPGPSLRDVILECLVEIHSSLKMIIFTLYTSITQEKIYKPYIWLKVQRSSHKSEVTLTQWKIWE